MNAQEMRDELLRLRTKVHEYGNAITKQDARLTMLERSQNRAIGLLAQAAIGLLFLWLNWMTRK